jgi:hypothetical protein
METEMMSIEEWTEASHDALIERVMDRGSASKTPTEHAAMVEIARLRRQEIDYKNVLRAALYNEPNGIELVNRLTTFAIEQRETVNS